MNRKYILVIALSIPLPMSRDLNSFYKKLLNKKQMMDT